VLLREIRQQGYTGGYTILKDLAGFFAGGQHPASP